MRREVEEEGLVLVALDEADRAPRQRVSDVFILPPRSLSAAHEADPADPVDDRLIVPVAGLELEQFRMLRSGWLVADLLRVVDLDRVARIALEHPPILHLDPRH